MGSDELSQREGFREKRERNEEDQGPLRRSGRRKGRSDIRGTRKADKAKEEKGSHAAEQ